jgi:hypothetical protein
LVAESVGGQAEALENARAVGDDDDRGTHNSTNSVNSRVSGRSSLMAGSLCA